MALVTKITAAGYRAAVANSSGSGFNIEIVAVESVSNGRTMGRFPAKGVARSGSNIILQATIKSLKGEEYSFQKLNLIESSGAIFATVENDDGAIIDSVTRHKNSRLEYTLSYVLAEEGKVTVSPIDASIFSVILHAADNSVHQEQFGKKMRYADIVDNLDTPNPSLPVSAYQGAILRNRLNQVKGVESQFISEPRSGNDHLGRHRVGHIVKFPDGRIVQKFIYQGDIVKLTSNDAEDSNILNSRFLHCALWEGMPNRVTNVYANLAAIGNDGINEHIGMNDGEPSFWCPVWYKPKNHASVNDVDSVYIYFRRVFGDAANNNAPVNIMITAEGY